MHPNRASPFASDFSPQARSSQGLPLPEAILPVLVVKKIAVCQQFFACKEIAHLDALKVARCKSFCGEH